MKLTKTMSLFLVMIILSFVVISCGQSENQADDSQTTSSEALNESEEETTENLTGRVSVKDNLPPDLDFGGETVRVYSRGGDADVKNEFYADLESSGDVINDAVYARNLAVQERLNVKMELIMNESTRHGNEAGAVRNSVLSGSDDYDIISNHMYYFMTIGLEGLFMNLNEMDYIDLTQPWWNRSFYDMVTYDGKIYVAAGELSLSMMSGAFCAFINRTMYENYFPDGDSIYDIVRSGNWTLDTMIELCSDFYSDINGNNEADDGDLYGFYYRNTDFLGADAFVGGANLKFFDRDSEGNYNYALVNDRTISFAEKVGSLLFEGNRTFRSTYNDDTVMIPMVRGDVLFTIWMLSAVDQMRDMEDDYGIIPMPKLDETQSNYTTYTHDGSSAFCIPVTCQKADTAACFLEAMCAESYRSVTSTYLDTALKVKFSRDVETAEMLDVLVNSIYLDFSFVYGDLLGAPVAKFRSIFANSANIEKTTSTLIAIETITNTKAAEIVEKYKELN